MFLQTLTELDILLSLGKTPVENSELRDKKKMKKEIKYYYIEATSFFRRKEGNE